MRGTAHEFHEPHGQSRRRRSRRRSPTEVRRSARRDGSRVAWLGWLQLAVVGFLTALAASPLSAQDDEILLPEKERQVKCALLYSFALMTTWPEDAFGAEPESPFVIGVLGAEPYPEYLNRIAQTKKIKGRPIVIQRYRARDEIGACHILFLTDANVSPVEAAVVRQLADQPALIVGESAAGVGPYSALKGMAPVQFFVEQGTVKFILDIDAVKGRGLQVDPRLVRLAKLASAASQP